MLRTSRPWSLADLRAVIERQWGFKEFRPLQQEAMTAELDGRDSLVVLPTGGGKSLCYQAPAVLRGETTVVVSPLISLMKDQVDSLQACGVSAVQIDSSQSSGERSASLTDLRQGTIRLLFVSPERLVLTEFCRLLQQIDVRTIAIDEAHCISHWGHDFRPEYRQLNHLREWFPKASIHAYTATATERVRLDICNQLSLHDPLVLVGNFDRPNLNYRVLPRHDLMKQVMEVLERHPKEAGILYCLRRRDVDDLSAALRERGFNALPYHAGLTGEERQQAQDAFAQEKCDLIVATVAFGMGIDRSNVRFVLHTAMPKSLEHYQQETGRAGRDGLEAECVLLHSGKDFLTWKFILEKSAAEPGVDSSFLSGALAHLGDMDRYCRGAVCRHRALVEHFGQAYENPSCGACDLCLGDTEELPEAQVVAQKILSCVARVKERFGINQVVGVLRGENTENIRKWKHEQLSTYGLLKEDSKADVRDWIYQLIGQGALVQTGDEFPVLRLNDASWEVMRGQRTVRLVRLARRKKDEKPERSRADTTSWEGVDEPLFDGLRALRRQLAEARQVPPYVIFSDATLRELARVRPSSLERMRFIYGIGDIKLRDFGEQFLELVRAECRDRDLSVDNASVPVVREEAPRKAAPRPNPQRDLAFSLFRRGCGVEEVLQQTQRGRSTVLDYLCEFIRAERPAFVAPWVPDATYQRVAAAARQVGTERLKPIFLTLGEQVPYDEIKVVLTHLATLQV